MCSSVQTREFFKNTRNESQNTRMYFTRECQELYRTYIHTYIHAYVCTYVHSYVVLHFCPGMTYVRYGTYIHTYIH